MRKITGVFASLLTMAAFSGAKAQDVTKNGVTVANPWARATPAGVSNGVAYLEIRQAGGPSDRLMSVASPVAGRAELHTHAMNGNVMRMRRVDSVQLTPGGSVVLKPHGDHVMLMDLKTPLKAGDLIKLTLTFEKAGVIDVEAKVGPVGSPGPQSSDNSSGHGSH
jgi:periplasmic copper chaperone A